MKEYTGNIYRTLGLQIQSDTILDIKDHLREMMAKKKNKVDYEKMSKYVERKFNVALSANYLKRLVA